ncbi:MAG: hypothetical protein FWC41_06560 [Firmicutes bacterium]|nr:hypothetical protein [Bacillota bacterium]
MKTRDLKLIREAHEAAYKAYSALTELNDEAGDVPEEIEELLSKADELQAELYELIENMT